MDNALTVRTGDIISTLDDLMKISSVLIKSGVLPPTITSPEKAAAIILKGREVGLGMMESFDCINIIQGKPSLSPQGMLATINRSGHYEDMKIEDDGQVCFVTMKRKNRAAHTESFSMADASLMGLANKDNWKKMPDTMRKWRAISACARVVYPDVIQGMYLPEELGAEVGEAGEIVESVEPVVMQRVISEQAQRVATVTPVVEVASVQYTEEQIGQDFDKKETPNLESEPIGEPFVEGILTYRMLNGTKMVKWGDAWKPAEAQNKSSQLQRDNITKKFKNSFELEGSLSKHFKVKSLASLTWEQLVALASWKIGGKADPRWYSDKITESDVVDILVDAAIADVAGPAVPLPKKVGPPVAPKAKKVATPNYPPEFIMKAYALDEDFPGLNDFIANMQKSGEPMALQKLMLADITPDSDWPLYQNLAQGLGDGTFKFNADFDAILQEQIDASKQPAGD